jgi:hypothetical protein
MPVLKWWSISYYPVNAVAFINDTEAQLSVLVDRSQGQCGVWWVSVVEVVSVSKLVGLLVLRRRQHQQWRPRINGASPLAVG